MIVLGVVTTSVMILIMDMKRNSPQAELGQKER